MASDGSNSAGSAGAPLVEELRAGDRAFEAHDYVAAARHYAHAVAADGRCASAWYRLGNARWRRGDREGAVDAYRRAVGEEPGRARAWQNLSTVELSAGRFREAAEAAAKAVSIDPSRSKAWNNLAVARFAQADRLGAEVALRRAIEADPKFAVAFANLGRLLADLQRTDAARAAYERALALGETDAEVRIGYSKVLVALGDGARAESVLHDAVRAAPRSADAWLALGDLRRSRSELATALEAYEAASAAAEDMPDAVRARLARRRRHVALELAAEALDLTDRDGFTRAADGLAAASGAGGALDDEATGPAFERCLGIARTRAALPSTPAWLAPESVRGVLERALRRSPTPLRDGSAA